MQLLDFGLYLAVQWVPLIAFLLIVDALALFTVRTN
jgi:hypothetical protein